MDAVFERFAGLARLAVVFAQEEARAFMAWEVNGQHLLLGLARLEGAVAARALDELDITLERLQLKVVRVTGWGGGEPTLERLPLHPELARALEQAREEADSLGHDYIGTAHLLLGLTRGEPFAEWRLWGEFGTSGEAVRQAALRLVSEGATDPEPTATQAAGLMTAAGADARPSSFGGQLAKALERSRAAADRDGKRAVDAGDLLLALAVDDRSVPGRALAYAGVDFGSLRRAIAELRELDNEIDAVRAEKQAALAAQEFERVAELRGAERSLVERRHRLTAPPPRDKR